MVVVRIKNLYDIAGKIFLLNGLLIISLVKGVETEAVHRLRIPDTKGIYDAVSVADNGKIIRNCLYCLIAFQTVIVSSVFIGVARYITAEAYFLGIFRTAKLERISVCKPVIGNLYLIAVADFLLKHPVAVTDTASVCGIA